MKKFMVGLYQENLTCTTTANKVIIGSIYTTLVYANVKGTTLDLFNHI